MSKLDTWKTSEPSKEVYLEGRPMSEVGQSLPKSTIRVTSAYPSTTEVQRTSHVGPVRANTDRDPPSDRNLAERQVIDSIADVATTFAQQGVTLTCRCSFKPRFES